MPQYNVGIVPGGAIGNELSAVTRRSFVPALYVNIYKATPTLNLLFGTAQRAAGGVSSVTVPVQGSSYVTFSWSDYSGAFPQPTILTGAQNAEFNLKVGVVPISFTGMEALLQSTEAVIPLMKARLADAKTVAVQSLSSALFATVQTSQTVINPLNACYDNGTSFASFGGINRNVAAGTFWQGNLITSAGSVNTRSSMIKYIVQASYLAGGETPDFAIMSPSDWTALLQDFMTAEQFNTNPDKRYGKDDYGNAGFRGLMLADTPIFMDPFCPKGTAYLVNTKYLSAYVSEDAPFAFSGFFSSIPNLQIANIGVVIIGMEIVCAKPSSGMLIQGITSGAF